MLAASIPAKFTIPFANSAGGTYIRTVPTASQIGITAGAASFTDGFVPLNFNPVGSGGVPPFGQDANGLLNVMSAWDRWHQAGGAVPYDSTFQAAISGYPIRSRVWSVATAGLIWQSTVDGNLTNPDTGGAGWVVTTLIDPGTSGLVIQGSAATGANLRLFGNGATTPSKYIRVSSGTLQILNNGYTVAIMSVNDAGDVTAGAKLRGTTQALGTGDANCATLLNDFNGGAGWCRIPQMSGSKIIQGGVVGFAGTTGQVITFPTAFPTACDGFAATALGTNSGSADIVEYSALSAGQANIQLTNSLTAFIAGYCSWIAFGH